MTKRVEPIERLADLRVELAPELDDAHVDRLVRGAAARRERSQQRRALYRGLCAGIAVSALLAFGWHELATRGSRSPVALRPASLPSAVSASAQPSDRPRALVLSDGSRATGVEPNTELLLVEDSTSRAELSLTRGRAHFEVVHDGKRPFSVRAGAVTVRVTGTVFDVEVVADRVGVSVETGTVMVDWGLAAGQLSAGERGWFPPLLVATPPTVASTNGASAATVATASSVAHAALPSPDIASDSRPSAQELFKLVDEARAAGQPERAVELLRQILRERGSDARAPLAAMTLGRMLLTELGRPREAAAAFEQVRTRGGGGPFAEDAWAREVEAWAQAGEHERAVALAKGYLAHYGEGRFASRLRGVTGL